jgi:hypothetical protein
VSALARIDLHSVVRAATSVNGGVATRNAIGIRTRSELAAAIAGRLEIPLKCSRLAKIRS